MVHASVLIARSPVLAGTGTGTGTADSRCARVQMHAAARDILLTLAHTCSHATSRRLSCHECWQVAAERLYQPQSPMSRHMGSRPAFCVSWCAWGAWGVPESAPPESRREGGGRCWASADQVLASPHCFTILANKAACRARQPASCPVGVSVAREQGTGLLPDLVVLY